MLRIGTVRFGLKGVALYTTVSSIENDSLIYGFRAHSVFHPSHDLEWVLIDLLRLCNGSVAESVLDVVLKEEGIRYFLEIVRVNVLQVQLDWRLDRGEGELRLLH
jgi:hypothetical protein